MTKQLISAYFAKLARRKAATMTREQRVEMSRRMNAARAAKRAAALVQQERQP